MMMCYVSSIALLASHMTAIVASTGGRQKKERMEDKGADS
jgi:hypothetical protein